MSASLTLPAPAKLNLMLHITGRRADGYHDLQTVFQILDYGDKLSFSSNDSGLITLDCPELTIRAEDNLCHKAALLLQQTTQTKQGTQINLDKKLPAGGGLGGGSSDAATTLVALNQLWETGLNQAELMELGLKLGADVPLFIYGKTAWAEGVGEQLSALTLPEHFYLVMTPACEVSTSEIFCHEQLTRNTSPITIPPFPFSDTKNDCEPIACLLYPEIQDALDWLNQFAPAQMTGTGASIFARFQTRALAQEIFAKKPQQLRGFIAQGVNRSPLYMTNR